MCLFSCSSANNKPFSVDFSADSTAIVFSGVDPAGLLVLRNAAPGDSAVQKLVTVMELPVSLKTSEAEMPVEGKLEITDSTVVFRPFKSLVPGRSYLVASFLNVKFADSKMMLTGQMGHNVRPRERVLER